MRAFVYSGELTSCLRTGRALRVPRARVGARGKGFISAEVMISQRPAEAADRAVPGHWKGDLIIGTDRSALGTRVERSQPFHEVAALAADATASAAGGSDVRPSWS